MPRIDLPRWDDPDFWSARGCVALRGWSLSVLAIAAAVYYTIEGYADGLPMLIAMLLAAILLVLATKEWTP